MDEAGQLQRETAFAKAQTKMTSLALNAKLKAEEAMRNASNSKEAAAVAALEDERRRVEMLSMQMNEMRDQMHRANEETTEAAALRHRPSRTALKTMRENFFAVSDAQIEEIVVYASMRLRLNERRGRGKARGG